MDQASGSIQMNVAAVPSIAGCGTEPVCIRDTLTHQASHSIVHQDSELLESTRKTARKFVTCYR
jgi:hypothetical protein